MVLYTKKAQDFVYLVSVTTKYHNLWGFRLAGLTESNKKTAVGKRLLAYM